MATYPYGMKDLPRVTALPRLGLPRATPINNRTNSFRSKTFTANDTFIVPPGVKRLEMIEGKGQDGVAGTWATRTLQVLGGLALTTTNPSGLTRDFETAYATNSSNAYASFGGSGERYASYNLETYRTGTDDLTTIGSVPKIEYVRGDGTLSVGAGAGNLTNANVSSLYMAMTIEVMSGGSVGAASTAFGLNFPGGPNRPASVTKFEKVAVTPLASYPIIVPAGGYITISFY